MRCGRSALTHHNGSKEEWTPPPSEACTAVDRYWSAFFRPAQISRRNRWVSSVEPDRGSVVMPDFAGCNGARYFSDSIQAKHIGNMDRSSFVLREARNLAEMLKSSTMSLTIAARSNHRKESWSCSCQSGRAGCDSSSAGFLLYRRLLTRAGKRQARAILNDEIRNTVEPAGK